MTSSQKHVRYSVHPAVAMAQAIIRNLGEKTGHSLEQSTRQSSNGCDWLTN